MIIPKAVLASRADWTGSMQPYLQLNKLSKAVAWINGKERFLLTPKPATETAGSSRRWGPAHLIHICAYAYAYAYAYACMHACLTTSNISTVLIDVDITTSDTNNSKQQGVGPCPFNS